MPASKQACWDESLIVFFPKSIHIYLYVYKKKNLRLQKAQISYTLVVNVLLVRASSVQSYAY